MLKNLSIVVSSKKECENLKTILPILKEKYIDKGKLRLEMRDFPLDGLALRAAAMARLVAKEKYYKFVNMLFNIIYNATTYII